MKLINVNKGYPFTPSEFSEFLHSEVRADYKCERLYVLNSEIEQFKIACNRAIVRYIPVREHLKEEDSENSTAFFVVYVLDRDLFRLGRILGQLVKEKELKVKSIIS